jgi:hypothetical protein
VKLRLLLPLLTIVYTHSACNSNANNKNVHDSALVVDSPIRDIYKKSDGDSSASKKAINHVKVSGQNNAETLSDIFNDYVARYKTICSIDSAFKIGTDTFVLHLQHYCLMDSAVDVPKKYVYMYKLDSFVTHSFITSLSIKKNNKIIVQRKISKRDFEKALYSELKDYGVLFCPSVTVLNGTINLAYSISIPLTDVGVSATAEIDRNGILIFKGR